MRWAIHNIGLIYSLACISLFSLSTVATTCPTLSLPLTNCTSVDTFGITVTLANPAQYVCLMASTVTNSTLVLGSDFCQNYPNGTTAQCETLCGNTFDINAAGSSYNASTASNIQAENPVWAKISSETLLAGDTLLQLPGDSVSNELYSSRFPNLLVRRTRHDFRSLPALALLKKQELICCSAYRTIPSESSRAGRIKM
jgi:hypothetical protein